MPSGSQMSILSDKGCKLLHTIQQSNMAMNKYADHITYINTNYSWLMLVDVGWWLDHDKLNEYLVIKDGNETMEHRPWDDLPAINPIDVGFSSTKFDHQTVPPCTYLASCSRLWLRPRAQSWNSGGFLHVSHVTRSDSRLFFLRFSPMGISCMAMYGYLDHPFPEQWIN